ncbi:hypothetical protein A7Q09_08175 [Methylacidiphilum sp. Yel]|nr:hypothetical protein A7Q09_08175 [Methylacidiphilum sp. Yel]
MLCFYSETVIEILFFFLSIEIVGRAKILKILIGEIKFLGFLMYSEYCSIFISFIEFNLPS